MLGPLWKKAVSLESCNPKGTITICHFNDTYELLPHKSEDPTALEQTLGGVAKFATVLKRYQKYNPIVTNGGDWLAPSLLSTFTKGEHMWEIYQKLGVHFGTHGNHDFDFGTDRVDHLTHVKEGIHGAGAITWIMSNIVHPTTQKPIVGSEEYLIFEWNGVRIGLIALSEDWIPQSCLKPDEAMYLNMIDTGNRLATKLKAENDIDLVIALTHNWTYNDEILSEKVPGIDLILGGHDHTYQNKMNTHRIVKSGTNFEFLSVIHLTVGPNKKLDFKVETVPITPEVEEDLEIKEIVEKYILLVEQKKSQKIGVSLDVMDATRESLRTQENGLANFVSDTFKHVMSTDLAFISGGTISSNQLFPMNSDITVGTIISLFPWEGAIVVIKASGSQLKHALEQGLKGLPRIYGYFPHFSGLQVTYNTDLPPGQRVLQVSFNGQPLQMDHHYTVATTLYLATGGDGYGFEKAEMVVGEESGVLIHDALIREISNKGNISLSSHGRHNNVVPINIIK